MPKHSLRAPWGRNVTALFAVSLLTLGACSDDGNGGVGPSTITAVQIVTLPNNQTLTNLTPGDRRKMLAVPVNELGNFIDRTVTLASSNAAVFTVSNDTITAVAGGTAYLRATAGGKTDSIAVGVRFRVQTVTLAPANPTLRREASQQLTATLRDTQNAIVTGRPVTWTSSDPTNVSVSATGLVSVAEAAPDATTATITATATNAQDGGVAAVGTTIVTVNGDAVVQTVTVTGGSGFRGNVGDVTLTATARSGLGNVIVTPITWTSNNAGIATVDSDGDVTFAGGTGSLTITGTATGAGAGGANVAGTTAFEVATTLINGVTVTAPDMAAGQGVNFAFSADRVGAASFVVATVGGSGDSDMYVIAPGVTNWTTTDGGGSNWVCRPWASGNTETCNIGAAAAGWYRIRLYAWSPAGAANGVNITVTHP